VKLGDDLQGVPGFSVLLLSHVVRSVLPHSTNEDQEASEWKQIALDSEAIRSRAVSAYSRLGS